MSEPSSGILGRISGKLLAANLERDGIDLSFRNTALDADLLYLDVVNSRIGINVTPNFPLEVSNEIRTINKLVQSQTFIGNNDILIDANSSISSFTGEIFLQPNQILDPKIITPQIQASEILINDNYIENISLNGSIVLDPNGSGIIDIANDTISNQNINVTGNIDIAGNFSKQGNTILGDDFIDGEGNISENDIIIFNLYFGQSIIPGLDNSFDLGGSKGDSSSGNWKELFVNDNLSNTNRILTDSLLISNQLLINGITKEIFSVQSNDEVLVIPATGVTRLEGTILQQNSIINTFSDTTPIVFKSTGDGFFIFSGTNGIVIPSGTSSEQANYEVGATRWNTDLPQIECFDGSTWIVATGPGSVQPEQMEELSYLYSLVLG